MAVLALGEINRSAPLARIALFARSFIEGYGYEILSSSVNEGSTIQKIAKVC
jgi:hypothetical protein